MKALMFGLALAVTTAGVLPAASADLSYGYGHKKQRVVRERSEVIVRSVAHRDDIRTRPWLHYAVRPQMICKLKYERYSRRGHMRPVEVCAQWSAS